MKPRIENIVTPKEVLAIIKARKDVIRAARRWKKSLSPTSHLPSIAATFHLSEMIDKLERLERKFSISPNVPI